MPLCLQTQDWQLNSHNSLFSVDSFYPLHCGTTGVARLSGCAAAWSIRWLRDLFNVKTHGEFPELPGIDLLRSGPSGD